MASLRPAARNGNHAHRRFVPLLPILRSGGVTEQDKGPEYELVNERSFDHERRPQAGETGHGYFFRLRHIGEKLVGGRDPGLPEPLAVKTPEELISAARAQGLLDDNEVLAGETALLAERLALYEGARGALVEELTAVGPSPPRLRWRGDTLEAHAGSISRSEHGHVFAVIQTTKDRKIVAVLQPEKNFAQIKEFLRAGSGEVSQLCLESLFKTIFEKHVVPMLKTVAG